MLSQKGWKEGRKEGKRLRLYYGIQRPGYEVEEG